MRSARSVGPLLQLISALDIQQRFIEPNVFISLVIDLKSPARRQAEIFRDPRCGVSEVTDMRRLKEVAGLRILASPEIPTRDTWEEGCLKPLIGIVPPRRLAETPKTSLSSGISDAVCNRSQMSFWLRVRDWLLICHREAEIV